LQIGGFKGARRLALRAICFDANRLLEPPDGVQNGLARVLEVSAE
jgi:hypothetical protein